MRRVVMLLTCLAGWAVVAAQAPDAPQSGGDPAQVFEVASIKPRVGERALSGRTPPDRFHSPDTTLRDLIRFAYFLPDFKVAGGPDWMASDRFEVNAKAAAPPTRTAMRLMVQQLLRERFALRTHTETREFATYDLVLARGDRRLGPKMRPAAFDCEPVYAADRPLREAGVDETTVQRCATRIGLGAGVITQSSTGMSLSRLVTLLENRLGRAVVDKTGLAGSFDIELTFSDEGLDGPSSLLAGATRKEGPAIFTALQEQLGLRLVSSRGPVEILVIDRAERPTLD